MSRILAFIALCAFLVALGIFGAVEHGADITLMLWTIPAFAVSFFAAYISAKIMD